MSMVFRYIICHEILDDEKPSAERLADEVGVVLLRDRGRAVPDGR
jgi:hypothetical protein